MEEHKAKEIKYMKRVFIENQVFKSSISVQPSSKDIQLVYILVDLLACACWVFLIYLLDISLILMHEIKVIDLEIGILAFWVFDPFFKWVKSF